MLSSSLPSPSPAAMLQPLNFPQYLHGPAILPGAPVGFPMAPDTTRMPLSFPAGKPQFNSGESDAGRPSNPAISTSWAVTLAGRGDERRAMIGYQQLSFLRSPDARSHYFQRCVQNFGMANAPIYHEEHNKNTVAEVEMRGLSMLNYALKASPEWREEYGRELTAKKLMDTWRLGGVQIHQDGDIPFQDVSTVLKITGIFAGEAKTWDIWSKAEELPLELEDECWLLVRREKYTPLASQLYTPESQQCVPPAFKKPRRVRSEIEDFLAESSGTMDTADDDAPDTEAISRILAELDGTADEEAINGDDDYYWTLKPWHCKTTREPPLALYSGVDAHGRRWTGGFIYVGRVVHLYGSRATNIITESNGPTARFRAAEAFIDPDNLSGDYKKHCEYMNCVALLLRS